MENKVCKVLFEYKDEIVKELSAFSVREVKVSEDTIYLYGSEVEDYDILKCIFSFFRELDIDINEYILHEKYQRDTYGIGSTNLSIKVINLTT